MKGTKMYQQQVGQKEGLNIYADQALALKLSSNFVSCMMKLPFGQQQGLWSRIARRPSSKVRSYLCIKQEIRRAADLEIPSEQWINTLVDFRLSQMKSQAGKNTMERSQSQVSSKKKVLCLNCRGQVKSISPTVQTDPIWLSQSCFRLWAKACPLIHTSPRSPSLGSIICPYSRQFTDIQINIDHFISPLIQRTVAQIQLKTQRGIQNIQKCKEEGSSQLQKKKPYFRNHNCYQLWRMIKYWQIMGGFF